MLQSQSAIEHNDHYIPHYPYIIVVEGHVATSQILIDINASESSPPLSAIVHVYWNFESNLLSELSTRGEHRRKCLYRFFLNGPS